MTPDPIRWARLFPELRTFDGPDARRAAWQSAQWTCVRSDRADLKCLVIMGMVGAVCLPAYFLLEYLLSQRPGTMNASAAIAAACCFAAVVAAGVASYQLGIRRPVRRHLRRLLIARGRPLSDLREAGDRMMWLDPIRWIWLDPIRWRRVLPEIGLFDTPEQRRDAWQVAWSQAYRRVPVWQYSVLIIAWIAAVFGFTLLIPDRFGPRFCRALTPGLVGTTAGFATMWIARNNVRKALREQLNAANKPICVHCGYDLRAVSEPRCPECGLKFDPCRITEPPTAE